MARRPPVTTSDTRGAPRVPGSIKGKSPAGRYPRASAEYAFITKEGPKTVPLPEPVAVDVAYPDCTTPSFTHMMFRIAAAGFLIFLGDSSIN